MAVELNSIMWQRGVKKPFWNNNKTFTWNNIKEVTPWCKTNVSHFYLTYMHSEYSTTKLWKTFIGVLRYEAGRSVPAYCFPNYSLYSILIQTKVHNAGVVVKWLKLGTQCYYANIYILFYYKKEMPSIWVRWNFLYGCL